LKVKNSCKENLVKAYDYYVKYNGFSWDGPKSKSERKIPKTATVVSRVSVCR